MNEINTTCQTSAADVIYLTSGQLASLTIANCIVSASSLFTNALVIYILIKSKQVTKASCKLIFQLSISDILIALFVQNLYLAVIYGTTCFVKIASQFSLTFLSRLSGYTIGIIGVDRYVRIKYKMRFKSILTTKFMMNMIVLVWMTAFLHAVWITVGLVKNETNIVRTVSLVIDASAFVFVVFLQLRTIREMNALSIASTRATVIQGTNRKVTKLCARIMLLFLVFTTPFLIINFIKNKRYSYLEKDVKSLMEFIYRLSMIFGYSNSFSNAVLFLTSNVKARRFLKEAIGYKLQTNNTVDLVQVSNSNTATEIGIKGYASAELEKFAVKEKAGHASSDIQSDIAKYATQNT